MRLRIIRNLYRGEPIMIQIIDTRPAWMIKEDKTITCFHYCKLFVHCQTRCGTECKVLGGTVIPKIREVDKKC